MSVDEKVACPEYALVMMQGAMGIDWHLCLRRRVVDTLNNPSVDSRQER